MKSIPNKGNNSLPSTELFLWNPSLRDHYKSMATHKGGGTSELLLKLCRKFLSNPSHLFSLSLFYIRLRLLGLHIEHIPYSILAIISIQIDWTDLGIGGPLANTPRVWSSYLFYFAGRKRRRRRKWNLSNRIFSWGNFLPQIGAFIENAR